MNMHRPQEAESVLTVLEGFGDRLTPFERTQLERCRARLEGDRQAWYRSVRRAAELAPASIERWNYGLVAAAVMNKPNEALEIWSALDPERGNLRGWFGYWSRLYSVLHMVGEHKEALEAGERACRQYPERAGTCLRFQAVELAALERFRQLNEMLTQIEALPETAPIPTALVQVVETLRAHGYHDAANDVLERATTWFEARPSREAATLNNRFWYGKALFLGGRQDEAQAAFDSLVDEFPRDVESRGARGFVAAIRGDTTQAMNDMEWLESYDWRGTFGDVPSYWQLAIAGALGYDARIEELLGSDEPWWDFGWYDRVCLELDPLRNRVDFQEFLRPKG